MLLRKKKISFSNGVTLGIKSRSSSRPTQHRFCFVRFLFRLNFVCIDFPLLLFVLRGKEHEVG